MSNQYQPTERNSPGPKSNNLGFIVGGLVVAVGLLLWFVLGTGVPTSAENGDSSTTNVTVETPAAPAPVAPAPTDAAPAPAAPAPAAPAAP